MNPEPDIRQHPGVSNKTVYPILGAISLSHLLNDMLQSLLLALYPILQGEFQLTFAQIGMITLTYQLTASLFQPVVGYYTDKFSSPYSLPAGMGFTFAGLILLANATSFPMLLLASGLVGTGSAVFHPEASRISRMAAGNRPGLAQSIFQVGGNLGSALGPLLAALLIAPYGRGHVSWFSLAVILAIIVLLQVSRWSRHQRSRIQTQGTGRPVASLPRKKVKQAFILLLLLMFSKYLYIASLSNYYTFYLIEKFGVSISTAQIYLFIFLFAVAAGTMIGGPIGDKIGRKFVIWASIFGTAPFALMLPYASLYWSGVFSIMIGLILASAFSAILVYAQELIPDRIGTISGLFFGLAFGIAGLGAAVLGYFADRTSIELIYQFCSFLPLLGMMAVFLPNINERRN